ncbi:cyclin-dependent kinase 11B-like [Ptychodera flava]|uniref:cyclin-dependent kinase 11B-like n=1 Tax=Ptychodera flava TaxID=63121 RepID=UPI00396A0A4A
MSDVEHHSDDSNHDNQEGREGWRVKTLDEILEEKKKRKEKEDKRGSLEDGELGRGKSEEPMHEGSEDERLDDALDIKPPQLASKKDNRSHRKEDRRKDKHKDRDDHDRRHKHKRGRGDHDDRGGRMKERRAEDHEWKERERYAREQARRREESRKERERLERLEREKQRDREKRAERERERSRREESRRRARDDRRRGDKRDRRHRDRVHRSRSQERREKEGWHGNKGTPVKRSEERTEVKKEEVEDVDILEVNASGNEVVSSAADSSEAESGGEEHASHSESEADDAEASGDESSAEESESGDDESGSASDSESGSEEESSSGSSSSSQSDSDSDRDESNQDKDRRDVAVTQSKFDEAPSPSDTADDVSEISNGEYLPDSPEKSPVELKQELPPYLPAISGCRSVEEFQCLNRIEEGTYGVVYRAKDKRTDEIVALKRLKMEKEKEGFPITSLREVNTLLKSQHPNIVTVREIVVGSNMDKIYIVMDYVEHDLKSLMETMKQPFTLGEVKCLLRQLLRAVRHLHDNWILHRDLKTSNLLLSHKGVLKVGDFGLAREYGSPLKQYTPIVVTLWYRAPELLLGAKEYSCPIDLWSVGCIFAELLTMKPLFPGRSEIDQLNRIFKELGTPSEKIWPGYRDLPAVKKVTFAEHPYNNLRSRFGHYLTDLGFDLINKFLTYNPARRITADDGLKHEYFKESPLPINESDFPTWPAKSEQPRNTKRESPKAPEGGMNYAKLGEDDVDIDKGFRLTVASQGSSAKGTGFNLKF